MKGWFLPTLLGAGLLALPLAAQPSSARDVMVVYDASGSMWGQIDGVTKIEIARRVMGDLVRSWPADIDLGLVVYGHRHEGRCDDIETLVAAGPLSPGRFMQQVEAIRPLGRTPLTAAVQHAADELDYRASPATIVLISDGIENCQADPCAVAAELEAKGIDIAVHVVGFDVKSEEQKQLACIAESTGGLFVAADDAEQLQQALQQVQSVIEQEQSEAAPPADPEPDPAPLPAIDIALDAPDLVVTGSSFAVSWNVSRDPRDIVAIVAAAAEEGTLGNYARVADGYSETLVAPSTLGPHEVRYLDYAGRRTLASIPIEVVEAAMRVEAPAEVAAGASFTVSWSQTVHRNDIAAIVPAGAPEGELGNYRRVGEATAGTLVAPAAPGSYEVRYILNEGRMTLASAPVTVVEAVLTLEAPAEVKAGSGFTVAWSQSVHANDIVAIVPQGAKEGELGNYKRVGDRRADTLVAPAVAGFYEVRYILNEGRKTLASVPVEVVEVALGIEAPATVPGGSAFTVSWTQSVHRNDIVAIVPAGAKEGELGNYKRVGERTADTLVAPASPGPYEVRYILNEGRTTLAVTPVEVTQPEVTVSGPASVTAGDRVTVSWSQAVHQSDIVAIVPAGAKPGELGVYTRVGEKREATLKGPAEPGLYEIRYILNEGRGTLASVPLEVLAK